MDEFEFNVRTLCLMEDSKLIQLLHNNEYEGFSVEEIKEALRVYDEKDNKLLREKLRREL